MAADNESFDGARLISRVALLAVALAGAGALAYAIAAWPALPDRVPTHFNAAGVPDAWSRKSFASVFVLPIMAIVMPLFLAWLAAISVSPANLPPKERDGIRNALPSLAIFLAVLAMFSSFLLAGITIGSIRTGLGHASGLGAWPAVAGIGLGLWAIAGAAWMLAKHAPWKTRRGTTDDPAAWKWGVFYVAPDDPSLFVEKRWGGGYTINFGTAAGRRVGLVIALFLVAMLALGIAAVMSSMG